MTKYILLARFSPRPDAEESESNDNQFREMREYVAKRNGEVAGEFQDADASGDDEEREGLWDAVAAIQRGYVLLVFDGNRLARSVYLREYLHREVAKAGGRIECINRPTDDTDEGVLLRQILSAYDEYSKKAAAKYTSAMMRSMQKNGRCMGGIPYGFKAVFDEGVTKRGSRRRKLIPDPRQQAVIQRIYELADQNLGSHLIRGILAKEGRKLHRSLIERILARHRAERPAQ